VQARPDGCPDEPDLEAEVPDLLQSDEVRSEPSAWDASDGARRDVAADAVRRLLALPVAEDAEKLVGPAPDDLAPDALFLERLRGRLVLELRDAAEELYKPDAGPFAGRSFAEQAVVVLPPRAEPQA
jgi:hypothetical protein